MFHFVSAPRLLLLLLLAGSAVTAPLRAELSDEEKKDLIRKQHQSSSSSTHSTHSANSKKKKSGTGSASGKKHPSSSGTHTAQASHSPHGVHHKGHASPTPQNQSPSPHATAVTEEEAHFHGTPPSPAPGTSHSVQESHPVPQEQHHPVSATSSDTALSLPHGATPSAPITIEKSGLEPDQGMEPVPPPASPSPASSGGFWGWLFGGSPRTYNYLSASTRAAIDHAPVRRGRWKYIIVHNSGTREGNARIFDIYHLRVRHMKNGLAYHFVIGDGHGSGDGQIEIGHRWTAQLNGGHVASDYLNDISLGICLVGDFNRDLPTKAQIGALEELIAYLRIRVGKTQGHQSIIYAHKEINPRPTDCPGDRFPYSWLHAKFGNTR